MMNPLAIFLTVRPYYFFSTTKQIVYILPRLVSIKAGAKEKKKIGKVAATCWTVMWPCKTHVAST